MKVRPSLVASGAGHALLLAWGLVNMSSAKPFDVGPTEALPIEIMSPQEFDAMTKGSKTSKKVDAPKVKAEKVAEADPTPKDDDLPVQKENVDAPPPPSAKAEPPTPTPPKPDPAKAEAERAEKAAKAEAAKAEAAKAEAAKAEAAKAEAAKAEAAKAEAAKVAAAKAEAEKVAQEKAEKLAAEKAEKVAQEKAAKAEAEKQAKLEAEKQAKAEAEKAAKEKAEAEKQAKLEAAKAAKEKAEAEKKAAERKFDPNKIAALLDRKSDSKGRESQLVDKRSPGRTETAARDAAPETTAGTERGTASKLSMSQRTGIDNAVREQVMQCWNPPVGAATDGSLAVRVQFTLNADGSIAGGPTVMNSSSNPAFRAAAGAATRAVQRCAPLKLPAEAYDYWRQVNINFDPKDMMGG